MVSNFRVKNLNFLKIFRWNFQTRNIIIYNRRACVAIVTALSAAAAFQCKASSETWTNGKHHVSDISQVTVKPRDTPPCQSSLPDLQHDTKLLRLNNTWSQLSYKTFQFSSYILSTWRFTNWWRFGAVSSDVVRINKVTLRQGRLVLRWVTVWGFNSSCGKFISV